MPPQSRGGDATSPGHDPPSSPYNRRPASPPTPQSYRASRPISPDLPTPTGTRPLVPLDRETPTPTPKKSTRSGLLVNGGLNLSERQQHDGTLEENRPGKIANHPQFNGDDSDEDEDDEFDEHYSREGSSPSSSIVSGGLEMNGRGQFENIEEENEDSEDQESQEDKGISDEHEDGIDQQGRHSLGKRGSESKENGSLHRVASLPASASTSHLYPAQGIANTRPPLYSSRSTTSLPPAPPPPLFPPFYNRPPTPLPPSPSLTSLLRPPLLSRSATSTRPTTPDSSDVETPNDTEAAVAQSARRAHPIPPTSPKVPTYEYYGFVLYLASSLVFLMYLLWSYLPSPFLHGLGITYYPNRWWSLAIPAWIVMVLIFIYVALLSYNVEYLTLPMNSLECMVDEAGNVAVLDENARIRKGGSKRIITEYEVRRKEHASIVVAREDSNYSVTGSNNNRRSGLSGKWINGSLLQHNSPPFPNQSQYNSNHGNKSKGNNGSGNGNGNSKRKNRDRNNQNNRDRSKDRDYRDPPSRASSYRQLHQTQSTYSSKNKNEHKDPWEIDQEEFWFRGYLGQDADDNDNNNHNTNRVGGGEKDSDEDDEKELNWLHLWNEGTDAVMDIPIAGVCEVLYGDRY